VAYVASTKASWALAEFAATKYASKNVEIGTQDGGAFAVYRRVGRRAWKMLGLGAVPPCATRVPRAVKVEWHLSFAPCRQDSSAGKSQVQLP
jgi:hypothetical protein